ncbi:MAG: phosphatidylglycerol lysyltransferase domain-containing protein, partial [Halocynthiibacter sp.]
MVHPVTRPHKENRPQTQSVPAFFMTYLPRQVFALALLVGLLGLAHSKLSHIDTSAIWPALRNFGAVHWGGAFLLTMLSYWSIGQYDRVLHQVHNTGVHPTRAAHSGMAAIAISQLVGLGLLTGTLTRFRLLPHLDLWRVAKFTLSVAISFLSAWFVLTAFVTTIAGLPMPFHPILRWAPLCALCISLGGIVALLICGEIKLWRLKITSPSIPALQALSIYVLIDTAAAAAALYVFFPPEFTIGLSQYFAVFLLAYGLALLSGAPAGIGPFELVFIAFFPDLPLTELLISLTAFRLTYYGLPALLGGGYLLTSKNNTQPKRQFVQLSSAQESYDVTHLTKLIRAAPHGEAGLLHAPNAHVFHRFDGRPIFHATETRHCLTALGDPISPTLSSEDAVALLTSYAKSRAKIPSFYKCSARMAATARAQNYQTMLIAREAVLNPQAYSTKGSSKRQLRRKLRQAEAAILHVEAPTPSPWDAYGTLPIAQMAHISEHWIHKNGGERQFSTGPFVPAYLTTQKIFLAYCQDELVAFATFCHTDAMWSLDLMRQNAAAPDGTMHMLIHTAITAAKEHGITELSLAAAPAKYETGPQIERICRQIFDHKAGGQGLRQFKESFGITWRPLYMATP